MASQVSQEEFVLDTSTFDNIAEKCKELAEKMRNVKSDLDKKKSNLMDSWVGEGRDAFEKKYRLLSQQFDDLKEDLMGMYEEILEIEGEYIQQDMNNAKALDGHSERY